MINYFTDFFNKLKILAYYSFVQHFNLNIFLKIKWPYVALTKSSKL